MSVQVQLRRDTATNIATFTPAQGEAVVDLTNNRLVVGDGSTVGGHPTVTAAEAVLNSAPSNVVSLGANGSTITTAIIEQLVSGMTGATVSSPVQIPAGALLLAVSSLVVTTITGAASFDLGYSGNTSAFGAGLGISVGSANNGLIGPNPFYSATTLVLTASGGAFASGAVRLSIMYLTFTPPTS